MFEYTCVCLCMVSFVCFHRCMFMNLYLCDSMCQPGWFCYHLYMFESAYVSCEHLSFYMYVCMYISGFWDSFKALVIYGLTLFCRVSKLAGNKGCFIILRKLQTRLEFALILQDNSFDSCLLLIPTPTTHVALWPLPLSLRPFLYKTWGSDEGCLEPFHTFFWVSGRWDVTRTGGFVIPSLLPLYY